MIAISAEKVCFIVVKLRQLQAQVAGDDDPDPGSNPTDDHFVEALEDDADDVTRTELSDFIAGLNEEETANLVALMWLGRGDADIEDWDRLVQEAADSRETPPAQYLMGTPLAADHIEDGLGQHGHSCAEFEVGRL
jgi:hypothetical protein